MKAVIIEDDREVIEAIMMCFELRWPEVEIFTTREGLRGVELVERKSPDFVILDLGLPDIDGFEVCQRIRRFSDLPIVMLTARDAEEYKIKGLDLGADDYITKPFSHGELLARVRSVLRRTTVPEESNKDEPITIGKITIDLDTRTVKVDGEEIELTPTEYHLLYRLAKNAGEMMNCQVLLEMIWGPDYIDATDHLRVYVERLQTKLGAPSGTNPVIASEQGIGYRLVNSS